LIQTDDVLKLLILILGSDAWIALIGPVPKKPKLLNPLEAYDGMEGRNWFSTGGTFSFISKA